MRTRSAPPIATPCHPVFGPEVLDTCRRFARVWARRHAPELGEDEILSAAGEGYARALKDYDPTRGQAVSYACGCVRGALRDSHRRWRRWQTRQRLTVSSTSANIDADCRGTSPFDLAARHTFTAGFSREASLAIRTALPKLPRRLHAVVWLRYMAGCSVTEIARRQKRSRSNVHRDLRRGLSQIRSSLAR